MQSWPGRLCNTTTPATAQKIAYGMAYPVMLSCIYNLPAFVRIRRENLPLKVPVTIRFDPDVLAASRATGKGWQTRVNGLVREWLESQRTGGRP